MTGRKNFNREAFFKAEARLKAQGFVVLNPAVNPDGLTYEQYMRIDFAMLAVCDCIYMLNDYEHSKGARAELAYAESLGFTVHYEDRGHFIQSARDYIATVFSTNGIDSEFNDVAVNA